VPARAVGAAPIDVGSGRAARSQDLVRDELGWRRAAADLDLAQSARGVAPLQCAGMGQDITRTRFDRRDFERFARRLRTETDVLHDLVEAGALSRHAPMAGLELEAWLVDTCGRPAARNDEFLARLGDGDVVTELGRFNVELNVPPQPVAGDGLVRLADSLARTWRRCQDTAASMGLQALSIGILPTLVDADLTRANQSDRARYRALDEQVRRQRHGRAQRLAIDGPDGAQVASVHDDVMLEAAATSFQVHLQLPAAQAVRAYNAAHVASAFTVALAANSPLLFGQRLWHETRIPLFEQALGIGTRPDGHAAVARVGFGTGYAGFSLVECFRENAERFEPLLPLELAEPPQRLPHLRLHNGTIWRWNRPLVGFDDDGTPHLRVEHRPMAAGPTVGDMMADLAFAIGLVADLAADETPPESRLPFDAARRNFYAAARDGLQAQVQALDGRTARVDALLLGGVIARSRAGLARLGVDANAADGWMQIVEARAASGRNGAAWQRRQFDREGGDVAALTRAYAARQRDGAPVHCWT
jgi:gamma-glutamyl:cysteine ligase YbdK (ATP-grasp superfamily)